MLGGIDLDAIIPGDSRIRSYPKEAAGIFKHALNIIGRQSVFHRQMLKRRVEINWLSKQDVRV